jgi:hypothetical protein
MEDHSNPCSSLFIKGIVQRSKTLRNTNYISESKRIHINSMEYISQHMNKHILLPTILSMFWSIEDFVFRFGMGTKLNNNVIPNMSGIQAKCYTRPTLLHPLFNKLNQRPGSTLLGGVSLHFVSSSTRRPPVLPMK